MAVIPDAIRDFTKLCGFCKEEVVWVTEKKGEKEVRIPIHAVPQANGNLTLTVQARKVALGRPSKLAAAAMAKAGVPLFLRHALLCPKADKWSSNSTGYGFASRQPLGTSPVRHANVGRAPRRENQRGIRKSER